MATLLKNRNECKISTLEQFEMFLTAVQGKAGENKV